jgi:Ca2+-binding EF-hand superfamily protein
LLPRGDNAAGADPRAIYDERRLDSADPGGAATRKPRMKYLLSLGIIIGLGAFGRAALADDTSAKRVDHAFAKLDTNNDGKISREEAKAGHRLQRHFDDIDADKDGFVTRAELKAFFDAHPKPKP